MTSEIRLVRAFLEAVAERMLRNDSAMLGRQLSGVQFENLVFETCLELNELGRYNLSIRQTAKQAFPDIIIGSIGVEVKSTVQDHWVTTGNSIMETLREPGLEDVLFFFGKLGGNVAIKVRNYDECLRDVIVTHSPRYSVDMNLASGNDIFTLMGTTYEDFRSSDDPMKLVRKHYRKSLKSGDTLWWLESDRKDGTPPVLRSYSGLSPQEKHNILVVAMALCPEVFSNSQTKFQRIPGLLVTEFGVVSPNVRDIFTAGGRKTHSLWGQNRIFSALEGRFLDNRHLLRDFLVGRASNELLESYWGAVPEQSKRLEYYLRLLADQNAEGFGSDSKRLESLFD